MSESTADLPAGPGGGYITRGRALELERQLAALEARTNQRIDDLERQVRAARTTSVDALRAQAGAILEVLRNELAGVPAAADATPLRRTPGGT